ncbi:unnamed protein product [Arctia plantaginis]|uniref:Hemicentin-1-like n=1 Tax=Arctia plantaginis TaxID=874455 RepID=A0A8S0ZKY4_ARCPL|nr:unnamed protein product [Arctia plantaginis]
MTCDRSYCVAFVYFLVTQICLVYGQEINKSSLTFVIDDSGSMTDEIEQVKSSVDSIFETVMMSKTSQIQNFVLVTFNDPDYILHVVTEEKEVFRAAASKVHVRDGIPLCPEKAMTGIKVGIENSLPLSTLYVFTDASAKDSEMYEEVKNMAQKKQIQVTFMLTGDCGSRENRRYKVYNQLARATNGEVFNLMKSDILDILEYVKENTKSRSDIIASKIFPPGYGNKIEYAVDSKMNDLIISVTGLTPKIEVTDSEGNKVDIKHIVNKDEIAIMKATDLKPGVYVADVGSTSETYVKVMAKTSVNFYYGFSPFETSSLSDTATRPAPDGESYLSIKLQGEGVKLESVKIFDMDGNILEELPLRLNNEKERLYVTKSFHPPNIAFQLSVFGYVEENKSSIKRTSLTPIERQSAIVGSAVNVAPSVTIIEGAKLFVDYRTPLQVKCKVHGYPKPDITWQEKDSGVTTGPSNVLVIEAPYDYMSILHIEKPNKNITYECKAQNTLDTIKSNIQIETNVYFNVLETPPDTVEIEYGKEGNIRCIIDASPPASISWQYNGSLLSNGTDIVISPDMQTVTIKHATLESQGIFICEVKNEYNTKSFSSKVSVIGLGTYSVC